MPAHADFDTGLNRWNLDAIAEVFAEFAVAAGASVMALYGADVHAHQKPDQSPVCDADVAAEKIILAGLAARLPDLPVVSEEAAAAGVVPSAADAFILVDPLDGTKEYLAHNGEFTVNLGLIVAGEPKAGVVYAPALGQIWIAGTSARTAAVAPGGMLPSPAQRRALCTRKAAAEGLVALVSRSHDDPASEAYLARLPVKARSFAGSSLKFCRIAEALADVYPRFGPTMEWDTAAGDAVLRAAGGIVLDPNGEPLRYGKFATRFKNGPFVAWGDRALAATVNSGAKRA